MKWLFFLFSMNLFLTYYPVEITSCDQNIQVKFEERTQTLELFNVEVQDMKRACELLQNASAVHIAFEPNIQQKDILSAWVFVDDKLLQNEIIKNGYGSVAYLYNEYKYTNILKESEIFAKKNHLGIWIDTSNNNVIYVVVIIIIGVSIFIYLKNKLKK